MNLPILLVFLFVIGTQLCNGLVHADQQYDLVPQNGQAPPIETNQDIRDIYGPITIPDQINWPLYLIGSIIIIAVIILLFLFLKRKKKETAPEIAPHITALAELAQARDFILNNQSLLYANRVSEILRSYIEKRFSIRTTRQTTSEFLFTLQTDQGDLLHPYKEPLRICLERCDLAKYAHKPEERENMEEMEGSIRHFIEETFVKEEK